MPLIYDGNKGVTFPDGSVQAAAASGIGFKNRIINGGMTIDQRNNGASGTGNSVYTVDRFAYYSRGVASKFTWGQNLNSVTPPAGFTNYLGFQSSSSYSVSSTDSFLIQQTLEGYNTADLMFGTANAKTITISFWAYSSLTGTFGGALQNYAGTRAYPFSYSIPAANTWTYITITIPGDTGGTWVGASNAGSLALQIGLGQGSSFSGTAGAWVGSDIRNVTGAVSVVGTNNAIFYITGVQLEQAYSATPFGYRPYGLELQLCQRYCYTLGGSFNGSPAWNQYCIGALTSSTQFSGTMPLPITMRTTPSFSYTASALSNFWVTSAAAAVAPTAIALNQASPTSFNITATVSGQTAGQAAVFYQNSSLATQLQLTAEL
jgi:hypothetical protein